MIVVFCLQFEKFFVYSCSQKPKSDSELMLEAELYYDYLKKYKPICIVKRYEKHDGLDIDKYVKLFMLDYGVDYVRGGSYSDEVLSDSQLNTLLREFDTVSTSITKREAIVSDIIQRYANKKMTKEEMMVERETLQNALETFKKEKAELESIRIDGSQIISDIQWITFACSQIKEIYDIKKSDTFLSKLVTKEFIERYKKVLVSLRTVFRICKKHDYYNDIDNVYVKYPHFLLDDFFYHLHRIHIPCYMTHVVDVCKKYEHMANITINKMDEKTFDVSTWGEDVEWRIKRTLYLLDKIDSLR
jgi:hypothetical protein